MKRSFETPEHFDSLARSERAFASDDRRRRGGTVESIRLHLANAAEYERRAAELRSGANTDDGISPFDVVR